MTLNSSGQISLGGSTTGQSIALELGQSATGQISLNDTNVRTLAGVPSGAIVMPLDFWGKSSAGYYFAINSSNTSAPLYMQYFAVTNPDGSITTSMYDGTANVYILLTNSGDNGSLLSSKTITTQLNSPSKDTSNNIYAHYGVGLAKLNSSYSPQIAKVLTSVGGLYPSYGCSNISGIYISASGVDSSNNVWLDLGASAYPACCYCYPLQSNYSSAIAKLDTSLNAVTTYVIPFNPWYDPCSYTVVNHYPNGAIFPPTNPTPYLVFGLDVNLYSTWGCCSTFNWVEVVIANSTFTSLTRLLFKGYDYGPGVYSSYFYDLIRDNSNNIYASISYLNSIQLYKITIGASRIERSIGLSSGFFGTAKNAVDSSGNVYVAFSYIDSSVVSVVIIKFNSSLTVQWVRKVSQTSPTPTANSGVYLTSLKISSSTTQPGLVLSGQVQTSTSSTLNEYVMTLPFDGSLTQSFTLSGVTYNYSAFTGVVIANYASLAFIANTTSVASGSATFGSDSFTVTPTTGYSTAVKIL